MPLFLLQPYTQFPCEIHRHKPASWWYTELRVLLCSACKRFIERQQLADLAARSNLN